MPTTRKKVIKTVYKDDADSEPEETGDFSDSGSEAHISEHSDSSDVEEEEDNAVSSEEEFVKKVDKKKKKVYKPPNAKRGTFAKNLISKISNQKEVESDEDVGVARIISIKDLTEADKLLPSFLNLSESDSSDDEKPSPSTSFQNSSCTQSENEKSYRENQTESKEIQLTNKVENLSDDSEEETPTEYKDVWSKNLVDSEEVAKQTFEQLQKHANKIEETKSTLNQYNIKRKEVESNVKDLLALGEDVPPTILTKKNKKKKNESDSEVEDWEEVKESKPLPRQGIQLVVDFPDASYKKKKAIDVEMMMRRKINRVKKEYQVYMHKVHVLCWLGHGNYINQVLNDQDILAAVLSLMPSLKCYPGQRISLEFIEQIVNWFKDKFSFKLDKNENKFKPKPYSLKNDLLTQISSKVLTSKKYLVYIFVSLLRALGAHCRIVFNFVTLPLKPPASELCSLATKHKNDKGNANTKSVDTDCKKAKSCKRKTTTKIPQLDGNFDLSESSDDDFENIMQIDGNDDKEKATSKTSSKTKSEVNDNKVVTSRRTRASKLKDNIEKIDTTKSEKKISESKTKSVGKMAEDLVQKRTRASKQAKVATKGEISKTQTSQSRKKQSSKTEDIEDVSPPKISKLSQKDEKKTKASNIRKKSPAPKTENNKVAAKNETQTIINSKETRSVKTKEEKSSVSMPKIIVSEENEGNSKTENRPSLSRKRSRTTNNSSDTNKLEVKKNERKPRTKSVPAKCVETSKYFNNKSQNGEDDDKLRVSHKDLAAKRKQNKKTNVKNKNSGDNTDPSFSPKKEEPNYSDSDEDFKAKKPIKPKKIDRRVISPELEKKKGMDVWCEVYLEEIEQWVAVDVGNGKVHCPKSVYQNASHPVAYIVAWNNNGNVKDVTRRYVPHWNTVTRKLRAEPAWWEKSIKPWAAPLTPLEKEEDEQLDRMQLEAPLPKTINEYKNHPLYALKRHLLKFEALYPPTASVLGYVRGEAVYARCCVHVCRSRDTWLKEAKVVKMGEKPYKIVKARPKWDKLSNRVISDQPLEVFGPWQIQDYEPPVAVDGIVPRNAYGNVELFKQCMLPKGTVHIKLAGLNKVARKLNIDCAPAMTGFDFNGGYTHPVFDGFVVCSEFEEVLREAHAVEQEEQERREREKIETRVYGNWKKLIKGLLIRERLKGKYGFEDPSQVPKKKSAGPRFIAKKR